jgi:phosphoribosyl-dephospho-CoA transferase
VGPVLDIVVISHDVESLSDDEFGWRVNSCLLCLFTSPARAHHFVSSVVTP